MEKRVFKTDSFTGLSELTETLLGQKYILMGGLDEIREILERPGNVTKAEIMKVIQQTQNKSILYVHKPISQPVNGTADDGTIS